MENEKDLYQEPSHYTCSVGVRVSTIYDFRFLVPKHLVEEMEFIEEKRYEIQEWVDNRRPCPTECEVGGYEEDCDVLSTEIEVQRRSTIEDADRLETCEVS